jgi:hypothetical protein
MKDQINSLVFELDVSLAATTPKSFAQAQLLTLRALLVNETLPALNRIGAKRYTPAGYQEKQTETVQKTTPVLDRISTAIDRHAATVQGQLDGLHLRSPLDDGDKAERLAYEREIRDVYRSMDSLTLEATLWERNDATATMSVLRSPLPMLNEDAKQRLEAHLRLQQYPEAKALEGELASVRSVTGFIATIKRQLLGEAPTLLV